SRIGKEGGESNNFTPTYHVTPFRNSHDHTTNRRGKILLQHLEENSMNLLNGRTVGDQKGCITHASYNGQSVIDLMICNDFALPLVRQLKVLESFSSHHFPVQLTLVAKPTTTIRSAN